MITADFYREAQNRFAGAAYIRHSRIRYCPHTKEDFVQEALLAVFKRVKKNPNLTKEDAYKTGFLAIKNKAIDIFRKESLMYLGEDISRKESLGEPDNFKSYWVDKQQAQPSFEDDIINTMLLRRIISTATKADLEVLGNVFNKKDGSTRQALNRFRDRWGHLFSKNRKTRRKMPKWRLDTHTPEGIESRFPHRLKDARNHRSAKKWPTTIYKFDEVWTELERSDPKTEENET